MSASYESRDDRLIVTCVEGAGKRGRESFWRKGHTNLFLRPPLRVRRAGIALLVNHHRDGHRRDVRFEHGQQLGDGHIEVEEIVTLDTQDVRKNRFSPKSALASS